jgi:TRAP transporter TAXI family solute receptor
VRLVRAFAALWCCGLVWHAVAADAKEATIAVHAGKSDSANYVLAKQFAEALALADNGAFTLVVEESQGSVQNVMDSLKGDNNYIFTAAPGVIAQAQRGDKPFDSNPSYDQIRALFPIPPQVVHWVVRQDSGIKNFEDLAGHSIVPGARGSVSERATEEALQSLSLDKSVQVIDAENGGGANTLKSKQAGALALTGSYPMPAVSEMARAMPIRLLSLPHDAIARIHATDDNIAEITIPKGIYPGVDYEVVTLGLPTGAYTTQAMSNATAYAITKAFWSQRFNLARKNPAWIAVVPSRVAALGAKLHKGALRYYLEAGIKVPATLR